MIEYKCAYCGAKLETEDSLSGKEEACPVCRKVNSIPLSQRDLAEQKRQRKEKLRQEPIESLTKAQVADLQAAEQEGQRRAAEEHFRRTVPQRELPTEASRTEDAYRRLGIISVVLGLTGAVICAILGITSEKRGEAPMMLAFATACVLAGFLAAIQYFAVELILQYLRRIMNAVEGRK